MKKLLTLLFLACAAVCFAAESVPAPRILTLSGAAYPKALIQSVSAKDGVALFAWLDGAGKQVDSGGSVARFTPLAPLPPADGASPEAALVYPDVPDTTLAAAITTPPPVVAAVPESIRSAALRYVLNARGLRAAVEAAVAAGDQNTKDAWAFETTIRRDHMLVAALGAALGLSSAQIDDIFRAAGAL